MNNEISEKKKPQAVWFNEVDQEDFEKIKSVGLTTRNFSDFVKNTFRNELDRLSQMKGEMAE